MRPRVVLGFAFCCGVAVAACGVREVIAHRGSSADRPENTLASYRRAIEAGATVIEMDPRRTSDGHIVSLHDARLERTTDGSGTVGDHTLDEIQKLDAGSRFDQRYRGERVPTLPQILELAKGRAAVLLDLKEDGDAYLARIEADIRRYGEPARIIAGVRSLGHVAFFQKRLPQARIIALMPKKTDLDAFVAAGVKVIRLWPDWLKDDAFMERVRKSDVEVLIPADKGSEEELRMVLIHHPTHLFTNDPERLRQSLARVCSQ